MKVIFSRKGFDSACGGQPSPILPDGTLLSLPIPRDNDITTFGNLYYDGKSYFDIIRELKPTTKISKHQTCHLDPDIRKNIHTPHPEDRVSLFGQCDAALTLLKKFGVKRDDVFLFFGWFKQTEYDDDGKLHYKNNSPDVHLLYAYLQIDEIIECSSDASPHLTHHPHFGDAFSSLRNNCVYTATKVLSLNKQSKGSGCFRYNPELVLTADGMSRSRWKPYSFFKDLPMTYHTRNSYKESYFQSAAQGQEFIVDSNEELRDWVKKLIEENRDEKAG